MILSVPFEGLSVVSIGSTVVSVILSFASGGSSVTQGGLSVASMGSSVVSMILSVAPEGLSVLSISYCLQYKTP
ncbi:hypothetical protein [Lysinibacillus xylanilyticus]|uniref:hypothetical protein n=1 Tax=Lysinibacillus xylanilyticus TaxID=582475 RepID=UPI003CFC3024